MFIHIQAPLSLMQRYLYIWYSNYHFIGILYGRGRISKVTNAMLELRSSNRTLKTFQQYFCLHLSISQIMAGKTALTMWLLYCIHYSRKPLFNKPPKKVVQIWMLYLPKSGFMATEHSIKRTTHRWLLICKKCEKEMWKLIFKHSI